MEKTTDTPAQIIGGCIEVSQRESAGDYEATLPPLTDADTTPRRWGLGATPEQAISSLLRTHPSAVAHRLFAASNEAYGAGFRAGWAGARAKYASHAEEETCT